MKTERILERIKHEYPNVDERFGYIPRWVYFVFGHPWACRAVTAATGFALGAMLTSLILRIL